MRFHNRAIDQVQTVARFCRESIENTLPDSSPRPAVEPIVRTRVRAVAFGQIAPRDPGPQDVKYCIYDPSIVRTRALPTLRHQRLKNRPFLIAEIESHDPPPPGVNHDPCCFSVNYAGTDPNLSPIYAGSISQIISTAVDRSGLPFSHRPGGEADRWLGTAGAYSGLKGRWIVSPQTSMQR